MARFYQRITIIRSRGLPERNINSELQWFGSSLGLFNLRDRDKSCFRLFIELLKTTKKRKPLSSDELGFRLGLSRGTVVHHLNKLMESGLVLHDSEGYILRVDNLKSLIAEVEKDIKRTLEDLGSIAEEIDDRLGL